MPCPLSIGRPIARRVTPVTPVIPSLPLLYRLGCACKSQSPPSSSTTALLDVLSNPRLIVDDDDDGVAVILEWCPDSPSFVDVPL